MSEDMETYTAKKGVCRSLSVGFTRKTYKNCQLIRRVGLKRRDENKIYINIYGF